MTAPRLTHPRRMRRRVALCLTTIALAATTLGTRAAAPTSPPAGLQDPALVTGTLPNGLRYYLRANRAPAHRAELRLVVNAGSALEDADQQGFAHFLEHMAFNGTRRFPQHSLIDFVEASGMSFGADLNAYTSFDETVYTLTVPTDDDSTLARGLAVLEDWAAGGIAIDSSEVVAERGVVLGEWRMRLVDSASKVVQAHYDTVLLGGTPYLNRFPIGQPKLLRTAGREPIARFYRDWYRPDLMAVVVVGDFDPERMRGEIVRRFGAIPAPPASARPRPAIAARRVKGAQIDVYKGDVVPRIDVLWPTPDAPREPAAALRAALIDRLLTQVLDEKLLTIRQHPSRPFVTASPVSGRMTRATRFDGVSLVAFPDSLEHALGAVLTELERLAQHGPAAPALELQKKTVLRQLESAATSAAARPSTEFASAYVEHYLTGEGVLASPEQELALARELLPAITPRVLAQAARKWRERDGLEVLVAFPRFARMRPPTRESVRAVFDSVRKLRLEPEAARAVAEGPLMSTLPTPGRIVSERQHAKAGITEWTLSNGARVLFKPSQNDPDEILLRAWSPGGFSLVPDSLFYNAGRMVALMMTEAAGLGNKAHNDLLKQLSTSGVRDFKVDIGYADESIQLSGSPTDLTTLFQTLHLQFTAPRLDTAGVASWASLAKYQLRPFSLDDQLNQRFARGEPRMVPVQSLVAEVVKVPEAMAVYRDRFGDASDFTFTIVGAATPEQVKPLVERYIATLPGSARAERERPVVPDVPPFSGRERSRLAIELVPRSDMLLVFDGDFPTSPEEYFRERERLGVVTGVLGTRLRERLREQLGATYSPQVQARTYLLPPEHYRVRMFLNTAPERTDEVSDETFAILDSLRTSGATPAELAARARIQQRRLETQLQDNRYWLESIGLYERLHLPFDRIVAPFSGRPISRDEFTTAARRYLPRTTFIQFTAVPRDSTITEDRAARLGGPAAAGGRTTTGRPPR